MTTRVLVSVWLPALSAAAMAAEFHPIVGVASSTAGSDLWPASNLIQGPGGGFSTDEPHQQLGSGSSHRWVTDAPGGYPSDYLVEAGTPVLVIDLGADRALSEISVWGYATTNANGVSAFSLRFASAADGPGGFGTSIAHNPSFEAVIDDGPRQSFPFSEAIVARYVEFDCEDNFYGNGGSGPPPGGDRVGLGEIAFADAGPHPDPPDCVHPEVGEPVFSVEGGTFTGSFALELTSEPPGAAIVFTTDGSLPSATNGTVYEAPITIANTVQIRAATLGGSHGPEVATESYVRLAPGLANYQSGLPIVIVENFGKGAIPDKGWTTSTQTGAGLIQPDRQPAYLGVFATDPETGIASIAGPPETDSRIGIRVRGAFSSTWNPKPYSLEAWKQSRDEEREIDPLGLPEDADWILYHPHPGYDRTMLYNTFIWELSRETGRYGTRFRFVDVFVNEDGGDLALSDRRGIYAFAEKVTRGGERIDFEPLSDDGTTGGWLLAINRMDPEPSSGFPTGNGATSPQHFHTAGPDRLQQTPPNSPGQGDDIPRQYNAFINFENPNGYRIGRTQRRAIESWFGQFEDALYDDSRWRDPVNGYRKFLNTRDFIDYFHLLNLAKQGDGLLLSVFPWVSSNPRKLHMGPMWDFNNGAYSNNPTSTLYFRGDRLWYPRLFDDPDYLREHIDRWYALRRVPLADENMLAIIDRQAAQLPSALVAAEGLSLNDWHSRLAAMKSYLTTRAAWIDGQFFAPPQFNSPGGIVGAGFFLSMRKPVSVEGTIHYTLDGSDPRSPDGLPAPGAQVYDGTFPLPSSALVQARILADTGEWSALNEATFVVGTPADATNLAISELMYHPADPHPLAEYVEFLNTTTGIQIDLTGVAFTDGVVFTFPPGTVLAPGERALVVANVAAFEAVHGPGLPVIGEFRDETRLSNGGERVVLRGANGEAIHSFEFDDEPPWPTAADGSGFSLVLLDPESNPDHAVAANWRRSALPGGTPGASDARRFTGDPAADQDGDGRSALLEYFYGTSDLDPRDRSIGLEVAVEATGLLRVSFPHDAGAEDADGVIEISNDFLEWAPAIHSAVPELSADVPPRESWSLGPAQAAAQFVRLRVVLASGT